MPLEIAQLQANAIGTTLYGDHKIYVMPDGSFQAPFEGNLLSKPTLTELQETLDRREAAREKAQKVNLAVPAITTKGAKVVVTGFNAGTGHILMKPKVDLHYGTDLYLDRPRVAVLLRRKRALAKESQEVERELDSFEIHKADRGYAHDPEIDEAVKKLQALEKQFPREK